MNPTWLYVAAVYGACLLAARRAGVTIPLRIAVLFYALVLGFLWAPMTGPAVNVHADVLKTLPPWNSIFEDQSTVNPGLNDVPLQEVPWAHVVRESWRSFSPPLWNPYAACGSPLVANAQSAGLSPLRLLALPLNLGHAMTAEAAMKILIALTFMFLYCRRHWSEAGSVLAAISFAFCGYLFGWLHFPHSTAACFLPAVLYFADLMAERLTFARFVSAAMVWLAILLAGHPETAAHIFLGAAFYALWLRPPRKTLVALAGAVFVAALLAAPYLMMFAEALTKSSRFNEVKVVTERLPLPYSELRAAIPMLQPLFFGPLREPWGPADAEALSGFAGVLAVAAWLAVAWHVVTSRSWRSREACFAILALLVVGVIFEWPGFADVIHFVVPFGAHARLRLLLACALAIQMAAAVDLARVRRGPVAIAVGVVAAVLILVLAGVEFPDVVRDRRPAALRAAIPAAIVLVIAAVAIATRARIGFAAMVVAVVAELWFVARPFNPPTDERQLFARTPIIEKLQQLKRAAKAPFRIAGHGAMLYQNSPAVFGFEDIRAHDPMANHRYLLFLGATSTYNPSEYFQMWTDNEKRVLDFLNVRYIAGDAGLSVSDTGRWSKVYEGSDGQIFENRAVLPRFYAVRNVLLDYSADGFVRKLKEMDDKWAHTVLLDRLEVENEQMQTDLFRARPEGSPEAQVAIVEASPTDYRLRANAPRYALVVSSVPWWPGWKVERNGKRIDPLRVNGAFLGFALTPGANDVRVWYDPWTWKAGLIVALATIVALIVSGIYGSGARGPEHPPVSAES